jgi:carbamoyl-phosphate synthase large subunit
MPPEWAASGNWLVTSVSAKVDLVCRLRHALNAVGKYLYATDCSPLSAGLYKADGGFICLPGQTEGFLSHLIAECKQRNISVVIPTRDGDLAMLSAHRSELAEHQIWCCAPQQIP